MSMSVCLCLCVCACVCIGGELEEEGVRREEEEGRRGGMCMCVFKSVPVCKWVYVCITSAFDVMTRPAARKSAIRCSLADCPQSLVPTSVSSGQSCCLTVSRCGQV